MPAPKKYVKGHVYLYKAGGQKKWTLAVPSHSGTYRRVRFVNWQDAIDAAVALGLKHHIRWWKVSSELNRYADKLR